MKQHVERPETVSETLSRGPDRRYLRRARPEKAHRGAAIAVRPSGFPGPVVGIPYAPGIQARWSVGSCSAATASGDDPIGIAV